MEQKYELKNWMGKKLTVKIDTSMDSLLSEFAVKTLRERYMMDYENSPQEAFARAAAAFSESSEMAQRVYDYASQRWFMFSTPVLANGGTKRGLPISCFLNYVPDSRVGITEHHTENAWLSSVGGGIGGYWGDVRPSGSPISRGGQSTGTIPFIKVVDSQMLAFSQGATRRGSYAAYMPVSHPEIEEFIELRKITGDQNRRSPNLHHAVTIPDNFMRAVEQGLEGGNDDWALIDPNTNEVVKTISAVELWKKILTLRVETGEPYIMYSDTVNRERPAEHKALNLTVHQSNLCSEIVLPTGPDYNDKQRTAVCCLSSVNLETFDEWREDEHFIPTLIRFLDNVLSAFIQDAPEHLRNAVYSAIMERSLGLGAMGFHSLLQKRMIPFESALAQSLNKQVFHHIASQAEEATYSLARAKGPCPDWEMAGLNTQERRNMYLLAIAPNASSGVICGTSPSVEPWAANNFNQKTLSGWHFNRNKQLEELLEKKGKNTQDVWQSVLENNGSVQHLDFLDDWEKDVFKTAAEIDQRWVVQLAADRQPYICQAQSINLFFPSKVKGQHLHQVHYEAWKKGVKTLYYCRTSELRKAETTSTRAQHDKLKDYQQDECLGCQG